MAALLGLLAFLGGATVPAAATGGVATPSSSSRNAVLGDLVQAVGPTSTVGGTARAPQPAAVRTTAHDRSTATYPGGWALGAALLLLAGLCLVTAVRRSCRPTTPTAWRRGLASRAPPALAL